MTCSNFFFLRMMTCSNLVVQVFLIWYHITIISLLLEIYCYSQQMRKNKIIFNYLWASFSFFFLFLRNKLLMSLMYIKYIYIYIYLKVEAQYLLIVTTLMLSQINDSKSFHFSLHNIHVTSTSITSMTLNLHYSQLPM